MLERFLISTCLRGLGFLVAKCGFGKDAQHITGHKNYIMRGGFVQEPGELDPVKVQIGSQIQAHAFALFTRLMLPVIDNHYPHLASSQSEKWALPSA